MPAKIIYLSDGPSKRVAVGKQVIHFKHTRPNETRTEAYMSSVVIQALRHIGRKGIDDAMIARLRQRLSSIEKRHLVRDARYSAQWIYAHARDILLEVKA